MKFSPSEHYTGTPLCMDDPEGLLDIPYDFQKAPARFTVPFKIGARFNPSADSSDLRVRQPALAPAALTIRKTLEVLRDVAQCPIAQHLKLHALRPRRLRTGRTLHDHRDRTHARGLLRVPSVLCYIVELDHYMFLWVIGVAALILHPSTVVGRSPQSMEVAQLVTVVYWPGESIWSAPGKRWN